MGQSAAPEYVSAAESVGLRYVTDAMPGIRRRRHGRGFTYIDADGRVIRERQMIRRFRSLAIPPAWTDVWICPLPDGHLQVTARDARGRKQYRYHPSFREQRDGTKFDRMIALSDVLWKVRERVEHDIALPGLSRDKVMATVVWLLERTLIRIGTHEYAKANKSFGLTTLRRRHVQIEGSQLRFDFRGKSGVLHSVAVTDRRIARIVQRCRELPGQELFQYVGDDGKRQSVQAEDINGYLREIAGRDVTAKDFRTWAGTMIAAEALREMGPAGTKRDAKKNVLAAIDRTAERLGNTRSVCRKYYIHPALLEAYMEGSVLPPRQPGPTPRRERQPDEHPLRRHEVEVLAFLKERLGWDEKGTKRKREVRPMREARQPRETRPARSTRRRRTVAPLRVLATAKAVNAEPAEPAEPQAVAAVESPAASSSRPAQEQPPRPAPEGQPDAAAPAEPPLLPPPADPSEPGEPR